MGRLICCWRNLWFRVEGGLSVVEGTSHLTRILRTRIRFDSGIITVIICILILLPYLGSIIYERYFSLPATVTKLEEDKEKFFVTLSFNSKYSEISYIRDEISLNLFNRLHVGEKYYGLIYEHPDGSITSGTSLRSIAFTSLVIPLYFVTHISELIIVFFLFSLLLAAKHKRLFFQYKVIIHLFLVLLVFENIKDPWILEYGIDSLESVLTGWVIYASILEIADSLVSVFNRRV